MLGASFDRFAYGRPDPQDKPLDLVDYCADIMCNRPIHFRDRCIQGRDGKLYCNESCFLGAHLAKPVLAGTEEFTI